MTTRVTFLLPTIGHPRHRKRVRIIRRLGHPVRVLAFRREYLNEPELDDIEILGTIEDEEYLRRSLVYARAVAKLRRAARESDVLYIFGVDLLAFAKAATRGMAHRPAFVVEVGDLPALVVNRGLSGLVARRIERAVLSGDEILVATTPAFVTKYFEGVQGLRNLRTHILENKVDPEVTPPPGPARDRGDGVLRIGWYGLIRCERSWAILKRLVTEGDGRIQVIVRGLPYLGLKDIAERVESLPNIEFRGRYTVPDDLQEMFGEVDMCWMAHHDPDRPYENWGWARSNRLYQSGWFCTPPIAQIDKDDALPTLQWNTGVAIDVTDEDRSVERLLGITNDELDTWVRNITAAPRSLYAYSDEHARLLEMVGEPAPK